LHGKERDFLHRIYNTHRILQGGVYRKEREFMESKEKEFGCQFFSYGSFFGVLVDILLEKQTKHEIPLLDEMEDGEYENR
jgi:hypothetical protein